MTHYKYLIIGGGVASDAAIQAIRKVDGDGSIGLIARENHSPYDRPPLSKGLWMKGDHAVAFDDIWRDTGNLGVHMYLARTASTLQPDKKTVIDHQGSSYTYDKLLIATGGKPRLLRGNAATSGRVIHFRTVDDYTALRTLVGTKQRFGVIGGGFIGSEIAAALAINGKEVSMFFPEKGICASVLPETLAKHMNGYYEDKGIHVYPGESVATVKDKGETVEVALARGTRFEFDAVIAGLGIVPETTLAATAGLTIDNGIVVDARMQASHPDIHAAGDVASLVHPILKTLTRFEHDDNANETGRVAGRNMAGEHVEYTHLPMFYSDLFDHGYEAVGEVNSRLDVVVDWKEEFEEGVFYYLKNGKVRGVLLWNAWEKLDAARALVRSTGIYNAQNLQDAIPLD